MHVNRILIATDGSPYSERAVGEGLAIASDLHARVIAVYVVNETSVPTMPPDAMMSDVYSFLRYEGEEALERLTTEAHRLGLSPKQVLEAGIPSEKILDVASRESCDMIVIGTHGRTGLSRLLLGSTAERVIRHSKLPVLVVRAHEEDIRGNGKKSGVRRSSRRPHESALRDAKV